MTNDLTLQQLLTERVATFAAGDRPKAIIDEHVEKMFKSVIDDCFRIYGDLGKAVSEAIKASLPANVGSMFELSRYNDLVATALREKWASAGVSGDMVRRAQESIDEILKDDIVPEFVGLHDLLETFATEHREKATENQWERPRIIIESDQPGRWQSIKVAFDPEPDDSHAATRSSFSSARPDRSFYDLDNHLAMSVDGRNEKDQPFGRIYGARIDGEPIGRNFKMYGKWERLLAALYFGAAKLVIDCDQDDVDSITYGLYD